jgi:hypothetical protein
MAISRDAKEASDQLTLTKAQAAVTKITTTEEDT